MKKIKISYIGVIDIKNVETGSVIQVEDDATVESVLAQLGVRKEHRKYLITMVNDKEKRLSYEMRDGDHLSLFLPVGGG